MESGELKKSFVRWFSNIDKNFVQSCGEKGANLGELRSLHLNVPNGFVVTTYSFDYFLEKNGLKGKIKNLLNNVDPYKQYELEKVSKSISEMIFQADFPQEIEEEIFDSYESLGASGVGIQRGSALDILNSASEPVFVAVRNSIPWNKNENYPREQTSYFNIKGIRSVFGSIKKVFASLYNPKTIYRLKKKEIREQDFKIAVVIQEMVDSLKSGVFISEDSGGNMDVKAIWGSGEGMNIKEIVPDEYILSKDWNVLEKKVSDKRFEIRRDSSGSLKKFELRDEKSQHLVLEDFELQRLANVASRIEKHFGEPQEIEFCFSDGEIYILQTSKIRKNKVSKSEIPSEIVEPSVIEIQRMDKITKTKLKAVLSNPSFSENAKEAGLDKVGLIKIENMIKNSGKHPRYYLDNYYINEYENVIYKGVRIVANSFDEFWVRTSDFLEKDFENLEGSPVEVSENPKMGLRGIKFGLENSEILKAELNALKRISQDGKKVGVFLPHVSSLKEIDEVKEILKELEFDATLGIIIETPASVQLIKDFTQKGISSVIFDLDNFTSNVLSVDKDDEKVKNFYDELHPAVLYQIEFAIRVSKRNDIETGVFGSNLKNKELLRFFIEKEIGFIGVEPIYAKVLSDKISSIERDVFEGTDREMRQYEKIKEREKMAIHKEEKIQESSFNLESPSDQELEKDIEAIGKEKEEYLENNREESNSEKDLNEEIDEEDEEDEEDIEDIDIPQEENKEDPLGIF